MVTDVEPKVFKAMLHFIYKDALVEEAELTPLSSCESHIADLLIGKLLAAADKYELGRLRQLCESSLCKGISVNTVGEILALADCHHATELKALLCALMVLSISRNTGPSLQSELLKTVAGCEDDCSSAGGKSRSVWAQLSDGGDTNDRRVRPRT
ncbi:BTB/POZ and MATH domain-containing protein 4 [Bienertia sinuspersici]